MRNDDGGYTAQSNMYQNHCDSSYMSSAVQAMPALLHGHMSGYECADVSINSPGYTGTPYSGTLSYPTSNAPDMSPFSSPLQTFSSPSYPSMDSGFSLNEECTFMSPAGSSFGSFPAAGVPHYPSSFHSESMVASPGGPSCFPVNFNQTTTAYSHTDPDLVGIQSGGGSPSQPRSIPRPAGLLISPMVSATAMQRSDSTGSIASNISARSKQDRRDQHCMKLLEKHIFHGQRTPIAPKGPLPAVTTSSAKSSGGVKKKAKKPNPRKRIPRVTCPEPDCSKDFRGDHEWRRHYNAKHAVRPEAWRIVDPFLQGKVPNITLKIPLKGCKPCDAGRVYNAAHNACAHFRRGHCMEKAEKKGKGKVAEADRRGGKAVGDDPPAQEIYDFFLQRVYLERDSDGNLHERDGPIIDGNGDAVSPIGVFLLEDVDGGVTDAASMRDDVSQTYGTPSEAGPFSPSSFATPSVFLSHNASAFNDYSGPEFHGPGYM